MELFNQLPFHEVENREENNYVHNDSISVNNYSISENNVDGETDFVDNQSDNTQAVSSNDRSSNNDPFFYDRVSNNVDPFLQFHHDYMSIPSYHTYPSNTPPSYRTNETPISYKSDLPVGETYIGGLEPIIENDCSDNDSVQTGDIDERHLIRIRMDSATRPTEELLDSYKGDTNSEGFDAEIEQSIKRIHTDSNRVGQILKKDLFERYISRTYHRKATETLDLDVAQLIDEVYDTDTVVKENLWSDTYDTVQNNPWSINGPYEVEQRNLDGFRTLPFHLEELPFESELKGNIEGFRNLPFHIEELPFESIQEVMEKNPQGVEQEPSFNEDLFADSESDNSRGDPESDNSRGDPSLYTTPREQDNLDVFEILPFDENLFSVKCPLESKDMLFSFLEWIISLVQDDDEDVSNAIGLLCIPIVFVLIINYLVHYRFNFKINKSYRSRSSINRIRSNMSNRRYYSTTSSYYKTDKLIAYETFVENDLNLFKELISFEDSIFKISCYLLGKDTKYIKKLLNFVNAFMKSVSKITYKGYLNDPNVDLPLLHFLLSSYKLRKIDNKSNYSIALNTMFFNLVLLLLLEIVIIIEKNYKNQILEEGLYNLITDLNTAHKNILRIVDPIIRVKITNKGLSILLNSIVGYDSEYELRSSKDMINDLLSVQLAGNTSFILKVPIVDDKPVNTVLFTHTDVWDSETKLKHFCRKSIDRSIEKLRSLLYSENDKFFKDLSEKLSLMNIKNNKTIDGYKVFKFGVSEVNTLIRYVSEYTSRDLILDSDNICSENHTKALFYIFELINDVCGVNEMSNKLKASIIKGSKKALTRITYRNGKLRLSITVRRTLYICMHESSADLSMLKDFYTFKENLDIVARSFVTLGKPLVFEWCSSMVHIRDTILIAPSGSKSLASIGKLYEEEHRKIDIDDPFMLNIWVY